WTSRYLERAEQSARVMDVHLSLMLDDPSDMVGRSLLAAVGPPPAGFAAGSSAGEPEMGRIDPIHRAAVAGCVVGARENARQIREQISAEMWEQLNRMYLLVLQADHADPANMDPGTFLRAVVDGAYLLHGVTEATLSHGEGWHYMQLGQYIERALTTASMLEAYFAQPAATGTNDGDVDIAAVKYADSIGLLRASAAFEAYCRHYTAELRPERLAEFLLLNSEFPRSVRFAVDRIEESLRAVGLTLGRQSNGSPERYAGRLRAALNYGQIDEIMADSLVRYVQSIAKQCGQVHTALYETYITYSIEAAIAR
ncbi:MAG: alpha-E domain-containing protein, partial [Acidobacteriota bacterium]